MNEQKFAFTLGQQATIKVSGETGEVIARAEYAAAETSYLLRYKAAAGGASETWWAESALTGATATTEIA